jgi:predicted Rossmann-fold nucleotide-binding protein
MHREALSFATFAAFGAAVREHNAGGKETPARPFTLPDEKGAYAALAELLEARPVVGVMGGYHPPTPVEAYFALGAQLARDGFHVLTGGGGTMAGGPVTSLLAGFSSVRDRAGRAIGVVPKNIGEGLNPFNETLIFTNLPAGHAHPNSRNHLNILLSDAIVALAGGPGTLHELGLARHYGRALAADCYWSKMAAVPDEVRAQLPLAMHRPCIASPASSLQPYTAPCVCHVRAVPHAMPLTPRHMHKVDALPADGFGFLGMPKFWEASGGAAAAAASGGGGGGLRLTAEGRRTREGVAEQMCGLESHCYFTSLEALPYVASEAQRARVKRA